MSVKYIPLNPQEHDNIIRTIAIAHMGANQGNPSIWVVNAMHEVFQKAFAIGFDAGMAAAKAPPAPPPAFRVVIDPPPPTALQSRRPKLLPGVGDVIDG